MALIKCPECGNDVSTSAKACPSCGAPPPPVKKRTSKLTWVLFGSLAVVLIGVAGQQPPRPTKSPDEQARHDQENEKQLAAIQAANVIKQAMKDPDSFELKRLVVKDDGISCITYRGRNTFNAMLQSSAVFTPGKKRAILTKELHGDEFVSAWNKACTVAGGKDITDIAVRLMK